MPAGRGGTVSVTSTGLYRYVRVTPRAPPIPWTRIAEVEVWGFESKSVSDFDPVLSGNLSGAGFSSRLGSWSISDNALSSGGGAASVLVADLCSECNSAHEALVEATVRMLVEFPAANPRADNSSGVNLSVGLEEGAGLRRGVVARLFPWRTFDRRAKQGPLQLGMYCGGGGSGGDDRLKADGVDLSCTDGVVEGVVDHTPQDVDVPLAGQEVWVELEYRNLKLWVRVWDKDGVRPALPHAGMMFGPAHFTGATFNTDEDWVLNPSRLVIRSWGWDNQKVKVKDVEVTGMAKGPRRGLARGSNRSGLDFRGRYSPLGRVVEDLPDYATDRANGSLPEVVVDGSPGYVSIYNKAWELAYSRVRKPSSSQPWYRTWIDEAFNDKLFQWDMATMIWFAKYMHQSFNIMGSMDIYYQAQRDDGGIARRLRETNGAVYNVWNAEVNPPLFAWAEWQSFRLTGDLDRVRRVLPALREYIDWYSIVRWAQDSVHKLYWNEPGGSGNETLPRPYKKWRDGGKLYGDPDTSAMVAQVYLLLGDLYDQVGDTAEAAAMRAIGDAITDRIDRYMWKTFRVDGTTYGQWFYVEANGDIAPTSGNYRDEPQTASLWVMTLGVDDAAKRLQVRRLLDSEDWYNTDVPLGTLPKSHSQYQGWGGYGLGQVMSPYTYVAIKGAQTLYGFAYAQGIAEKYLDAIAEVYEYSGTIWEHYAPDYQSYTDVTNSLYYIGVLESHRTSGRSACTTHTTPKNSNQRWGCEIVKTGYTLPPGNYAAPARRRHNEFDHNPGGVLDVASTVKPDFVGWGGIGPIAMLIEDVIGIQPDVIDKEITWYLNRTDRHGLRNLPMGDLASIDLIAAARTDTSSPALVTVNVTPANADATTTATLKIIHPNYADCATVHVIELGSSTPQQFTSRPCPELLVSNRGQSGDQSVTYDRDHGQAFTTGNSPSGYRITSVAIVSEDSDNDPIDLKICEVDGDGYPTDVCTNLTPPDSFLRGDLVFTVPDDSTFEFAPGTTYMVVFKAPTNPGEVYVDVDATSSNGEDSRSLPGWSIRNRFQRNHPTGWQDAGRNHAIRILIRGLAIPSPAPSRPAKPIVAPVPGTYDSLKVTWTPPDNTGRTAITGYSLNVISSGDTTNIKIPAGDTTHTLTGLGREKYTIEIRAQNARGASDWSPQADGLTNRAPQLIGPNDSLVPSGLGTGDVFRLLFVTSGTFDADTADHEEYYSHALTETALSSLDSLAECYRCARPLISTGNIDARTITNTVYTDDDKGLPIYWLGGSKVADNYADFYDGSWANETSATDRNGNTHPLLVGPWTGSANNGAEFVDGMVSGALGESLVGYGAPGSTTAGIGPLYSGSTAVNTGKRPMYVLTGPFEVGAPLLVSNYEQGETSVIHNSNTRRQSFTTGNNRFGYVLESVNFEYAGSSGERPGFSVTVFEMMGTRLGTTIAVLNPPANFHADFPDHVFTAPENTVLAANTTYALVVQSDRDVGLSATSSNSEETGGLDDWSIADVFNIGTVEQVVPVPDADGNALAIELRGTLAVGISLPPTGLSALAIGSTRVDLSWTAPTDIGGAAVTGYKIESSANADTGWSVLVADTGSPDITHSYLSPTTITDAYYRVSAINTEGVSEPSDTAALSDENPVPVSVSFSQSVYQSQEGRPVTPQMEVSLSADPRRVVVIPLTVTPQDGVSPEDYSITTESVTFTPADWATPKEVEFVTTGDDVDDDQEIKDVLVGFGDLPPGVTVGTTPEATVRIYDDDFPQVTVSFGSDTYTVSEGGTGTVSVEVLLSVDPERAVEISLTALPQGGADPGDYSVPQSVTFNSGETSKLLPVSAVDDRKDDDGESVLLSLRPESPLPDGVIFGATLGATPEATVSIIDDDDPTVPAFSTTDYPGDAAALSVAENFVSGDPVGVVATTDVDGDALTYSVAATADADAADDLDAFKRDFSINASGRIRVKDGAAIDFETRSSYKVLYQVSDREDAVGDPDTAIDDTLTLTVTALNVDEAGVVTITGTPRAGVELSATLTDPDGSVPAPSWSWSRSGTRTGTFSVIDGAAAASYTPGGADVVMFLKVSASYTDAVFGAGKTASGTAASAVEHSVPVFSTTDYPGDEAALPVEENTASGVVVGVVAATDADSDALTYSVAATADVGAADDLDAFERAFSINASGRISVKDGAAIDFETRSSYKVLYQVSDSVDAAGTPDTVIDDTLTLTVTALNVDEAGVVTITGTPRAGVELSATLGADPDGSVSSVSWSWSRAGTRMGTFSVIGGAAAASYTPGGADVGMFLKASASYTDAVFGAGRTASGTAASAVEHSVPVFSTTDYPVSAAALSVAENSVSGVVVGVVAATDADGDALTYSVAATADVDAADDLVAFERAFSINASGRISVKDGAAIDFETRSSYKVLYQVSDSVDAAGTPDTVIDDTLTLTVTAVNVDEAGVVTITGTPRAGVELSATLTDPDGPVPTLSVSWSWSRAGTRMGTFSVIGGAAAASYTPGAADVVMFLKASATYTDAVFGAGRTASGTAASAVEHSVPVFSTTGYPVSAAALSVAENSVSGVVVGVVAATDADSDALTYSVAATADVDAADDLVAFERAFNIDSASGRISVKDGAAIDFETRSSYKVLYQVSDSVDAAGTPDTAIDDTLTLTVTVLNVDEAGVVTISGTPRAGVELSATLTDPDGPVPTLSVSWSWSRAGTRMGTFSVIGGAAAASYTPGAADVVMFLKASATYTDGFGAGRTASGTAASAVEHSVPVFSTDGYPGGAAALSVAENSVSGVVVGVVAATDADGDALTYSVAATADVDAAAILVAFERDFNIDSASGRISVKDGAAIDFETRSSYKVQVQVSDSVDAAGNEDTAIDDTLTLTVTALNVDEAGAVTISGTPRAGVELSATLTDPDGSVSTLSVSWSWSRAGTRTGPFSVIGGAAAASYTPGGADVVMFLKASATYTDGFGAGRTASGTAASAVEHSVPVFSTTGYLALIVHENW